MSNSARHCVRAGKLVLGNFLVLALGIISLELFFGDWFGHRLWGLLCDVQFVYSAKAIYGVEKTTHYVRDTQCLRGRYDPLSIDVITVGGSATDQRYLTEGETWQDRAAAYFAQHGRRLSIANAGVDGQSTIGHLWDFSHWFPLLSSQPKFYLFYVGVNDIYRTTPSIGYDEHVQPVDSVLRKIKARSALYRLKRTVVGMWEAREMGVGHKRIDFAKKPYTEKGILSDFSFYKKYLREIFLPRLDRLVRATNAIGSQPIFVTQRTYMWKEENGRIFGVAKTSKVGGIVVNGIDRYLMEIAMADAILNFCKERQLTCIDGHRALGASEDFYDFAHNTPQGAERLGAYIGARLLDVIH